MGEFTYDGMAASARPLSVLPIKLAARDRFVRCRRGSVGRYWSDHWIAPLDQTVTDVWRNFIRKYSRSAPSDVTRAQYNPQHVRRGFASVRSGCCRVGWGGTLSGGRARGECAVDSPAPNASERKQDGRVALHHPPSSSAHQTNIKRTYRPRFRYAGH